MKGRGALTTGVRGGDGGIGAEEVQRMTGVIAGELSYPSQAIAAPNVVARSLDDGRDVTLRKKENRRRCRLRVPAGRYHAFAIPEGNRDPPLRGAYTSHSQCNHIIRSGGTSPSPCRAGPPLAVTVHAGKTSPIVHIDNWSLTEEAAHSLQRPADVRRAAGR